MLDYSTFEGLAEASVGQSTAGAALSRYCTGCSTVLPLAAFYARASKCKECTKAAVRANRLAKLDYYQSYDGRRANDVERVRARAAYAKTEDGKARLSAGKERWRLDNTEKRRAHNLVSKALRSGKLQRWACEICGNEKTEAHHVHYGIPLAVVWLCDDHHKQVHNEHREMQRALLYTR